MIARSAAFRLVTISSVVLVGACATQPPRPQRATAPSMVLDSGFIVSDLVRTLKITSPDTYRVSHWVRKRDRICFRLEVISGSGMYLLDAGPYDVVVSRGGSDTTTVELTDASATPKCVAADSLDQLDRKKE